MKVQLAFGEKIINIPALAAKNAAKDATREQLAILILIADNPSSSISALAEIVGISEDEVLDAVEYWKRAGVLTYRLSKGEKPEAKPSSDAKQTSSGKKSAKAEVVTSSDETEKKPIMSAGEIPDYTIEQTASFFENTPGAARVIDCSSQIFGKMMTPSEVKVLMGLLDYLALSPDYVILLATFCAENGKKSVRYLEKTAITLYDSGITEYAELEEYVRNKRETDSVEGELRTLFGIGKRALTKRENECFMKWIAVFHYGIDVITEAYEITVTNTAKPSVPYADKVIERWHGAGYKTIDEIKSAIDDYKKTKDAADGGTFNTDDFFEAALKRSYSAE